MTEVGSTIEALWPGLAVILAIGCGSGRIHDDGSGTANDSAGDDGGTYFRRDASTSVAPPVRSMDAGLLDASLDDGGPIGDPDGSLARAARDFLDSIGVGAHVGQGVDDPLRSAQAIAYAGISSLRERGTLEIGDALLMMHGLSGVRIDVQTNVEREGDQSIPNLIALAKKLQAAGALLAIEGPNEPNNYTVTYQGKTADWEQSFLPVAHYQRDLYAAVRAERSLDEIPVFHSSTAGGTQPDNVGLQFLTIPKGAKTLMPDQTKYADYANVHNYVCGHRLELVDNHAWKATDPVLDDDWDGMLGQYGVTWHRKFVGYPVPQLPTLPKVSTETGWTTQGKGAITEEQQGRLFLNLFFSGFVRDYDYTFIYMLRDDPVQGYWGLFDVAYEPKRSAVYLHNLTTILDDRDRRVPGRLEFSISPLHPTVHSVLLQKRNALFELVVWNDRPAGGSDRVTIDLGRARSRVRVYDPTLGTDAIATHEDVRILDLTLTDHPLLLEYDPRGDQRLLP